MSFRRILNPDKLLLKQYKLSRGERAEMIARGTVMAQFAIPIGSALYFLFTQVSYIAYAKNETPLTVYGSVKPGDWWDRLPVHLQNLFGSQMFGITGPAAPAWWVTARHDFRHVLIGFLAVLLVGAFGVGLKYYKPVSKWRMAASVPLAFAAAFTMAGGLIAFFAWHPVAHGLSSFGTSTGIPYIGDLIGKGTIQLTLIGVLAGFAAKKILAPTFAQLQLMSIDRNLAQEQADGKNALSGAHRYVYGANYRNRLRYFRAETAAGRHVPQPGSRWLGITLSLAAPVVMFLLAFGVWLNYFGPAVNAH